jgi:hypothetical protein
MIPRWVDCLPLISQLVPCCMFWPEVDENGRFDDDNTYTAMKAAAVNVRSPCEGDLDKGTWTRGWKGAPWPWDVAGSNSRAPGGDVLVPDRGTAQRTASSRNRRGGW